MTVEVMAEERSVRSVQHRMHGEWSIACSGDKSRADCDDAGNGVLVWTAVGMAPCDMTYSMGKIWVKAPCSNCSLTLALRLSVRAGWRL